MSRIIVLGAGRSSCYLLQYLSGAAAANDWTVLVCDRDEDNLNRHAAGLNLNLQVADISDATVLDALLQHADLAVSLLPPAMHMTVAGICLRHGVHLATASYVSAEMKKLDEAARERGLVFLNEMGLDPGIDHMSAMKAMDEIRAGGGEVLSFESYCGGLVQEEDCAGNPWKYKFSWNPRNVVLAGQGGMSVFRRDGALRCIPWHQLFAHGETLEIPGLGAFDAYANRDSLGYEQIYKLENAGTLYRGTLRRSGFCSAWQLLVQLGFTDAGNLLDAEINHLAALTNALTGKKPGEKFTDWLVRNLPDKKVLIPYFSFLDMEDAAVVGTESMTAADILQARLMKVWDLQPADRDEVVMYHRIRYKQQDAVKTYHAVLDVSGEDEIHTAMAKTVGLPLAMGVELILSGKVSERGVAVPVSPVWYGPVLDQLKAFGIGFHEFVE